MTAERALQLVEEEPAPTVRINGHPLEDARATLALLKLIERAVKGDVKVSASNIAALKKNAYFLRIFADVEERHAPVIKTSEEVLPP